MISDVTKCLEISQIMIGPFYIGSQVISPTEIMVLVW